MHDATRDDLLLRLLGPRLGSGVDREVFPWYGPDTDQKLVVKLAYGEYDFQNVAEWQLWQEATPNLRQWLAPVRGISPGGRALWMVYCEPCPSHLLPLKMPAVLRDLHRDNIGLYEGRPVALDYGRHVAAALAANMKAMRRLDRADT